VVADNYLDGGYHVEFAHPALANGLEGSSYVSELYPNMSIQSARAAAEGDDSRLGDSQVAYAFVYPNIMINRCVRALSRLTLVSPPSSVGSLVSLPSATQPFGNPAPPPGHSTDKYDHGRNSLRPHSHHTCSSLIRKGRVDTLHTGLYVSSS